MLRASRSHYWLNTGFGMFFSALNLWMHEYFFVLELMRPAIIWTALRDDDLDFRARLRRTLSLWTPYLIVFVAAVLSRLFIFNNQIYEIGGDQTVMIPFNLHHYHPDQSVDGHPGGLGAGFQAARSGGRWSAHHAGLWGGGTGHVWGAGRCFVLEAGPKRRAKRAQRCYFGPWD